MARWATAVGVTLAMILASVGCRGEDSGAEVRSDPGVPASDAGRRTRIDERIVAGLRTLVVQPRDGGPYPLVVFVHGAGAPPEFYEGLLTDLAAAGNVVVAPAMPGSSDEADAEALLALPFQPGRVRQVMDAVLDGPQAIPTVDDEAVAVAGHSLGAMTALATAFNGCCVDRRVDAVVAVAGQLATFPAGTWNAGSVPVLLVHGRLDDTVAYAGSGEAFQEVGTSAYLLTVERGDHGGYLSDEDDDYLAVRDSIVAFLLATLADQPQAGLADLVVVAGEPGVRLRRRG